MSIKKRFEGCQCFSGSSSRSKRVLRLWVHAVAHTSPNQGLFFIVICCISAFRRHQIIVHSFAHCCLLKCEIRYLKGLSANYQLQYTYSRSESTGRWLFMDNNLTWIFSYTPLKAHHHKQKGYIIRFSSVGSWQAQRVRFLPCHRHWRIKSNSSTFSTGFMPLPLASIDSSVLLVLSSSE